MEQRKLKLVTPPGSNGFRYFYFENDESTNITSYLTSDISTEIVERWNDYVRLKEEIRFRNDEYRYQKFEIAQLTDKLNASEQKSSNYLTEIKTLTEALKISVQENKKPSLKRLFNYIFK